MDLSLTSASETNVKDSSNHRRAVPFNETFSVKVDTNFKHSNKDNLWGTVKNNGNIAQNTVNSTVSGHRQFRVTFA